MKKSIVMIMALAVMGSILCSCGTRLFTKGYRQGHHATRHGQKAQLRASKAARHFWF